jgi:hypothetical protein
MTDASQPFSSEAVKTSMAANNSTHPPVPAAVETQNPFSPAFWVSLWTALLAGLAGLSAAALGWRADKRAIRELQLKIQESERLPQNKAFLCQRRS